MLQRHHENLARIFLRYARDTSAGNGSRLDGATMGQADFLLLARGAGAAADGLPTLRLKQVCANSSPLIGRGKRPNVLADLEQPYQFSSTGARRRRLPDAPALAGLLDPPPPFFLRGMRPIRPTLPRNKYPTRFSSSWRRGGRPPRAPTQAGSRNLSPSPQLDVSCVPIYPT